MLTGAAGGDLFALLGFAVVATGSPGGATLLVTISGARHGVWRSLPLLGGIAAGLAALLVLAGAGLGTLVQAVPGLHLGMRVAGSAYLLWLAWRIARSGPPTAAGAGDAPRPGFLAGMALLWLNPKAWAMSLAASAAFGGLASSPAALGALLGTVFGIAGACSLLFWCASGQLLARRLKTEAAWRRLNQALGALLAASVIPLWL